MLTRWYFGEPVILSSGLHLKKGNLGADLFLHRLEADERVELGLNLFEWSGWSAECSSGQADVSESLIYPSISRLFADVLAGLFQSFLETFTIRHT